MAGDSPKRALSILFPPPPLPSTPHTSLRKRDQLPVAIKVIAEHSARGAALLEFLGPNKEVIAREQKLREFARRATD